MNEKVFYQSHPVNSDSIEIKRIMAVAVQQAWELYRIPKKQIAIDLHIPPPVLSHYLSVKCGYTIPAHLVRRFCEIVKDWSLSRALQRRLA